MRDVWFWTASLSDGRMWPVLAQLFEVRASTAGTPDPTQHLGIHTRNSSYRGNSLKFLFLYISPWAIPNILPPSNLGWQQKAILYKCTSKDSQAKLSWRRKGGNCLLFHPIPVEAISTWPVILCFQRCSLRDQDLKPLKTSSKFIQAKINWPPLHRVHQLPSRVTADTQGKQPKILISSSVWLVLNDLVISGCCYW